MEKTCPHRVDLAAYLTGDLQPAAQHSLQAHLRECPACRAELATVENTLEKLRHWPHRPVSPNFSARVLAEIASVSPAKTKLVRWPQLARWTATAAAVTFVSTLAVQHFQNGKRIASPAQPTQTQTEIVTTMPPVQSSREMALDWLCRTQEPDGSWNPEKWGGDARFSVSLTALPLLAFIQSDAPLTEASKATIARAINRLKLWQSADGAFGPKFHGQPLNQSLATLALLHAKKHGMLPTDDLFVLHKALPLVVQNSQSPAPTIFAKNPNLLWQRQVLELAGQTDWPSIGNTPAALPETNAPKSSKSSTPIGHALAAPSAKTFDFVQAYALALSDANADQTELRDFLLTTQIHQGAEIGSWDPEIDRWGAVGGRVYTTSLALLALR